MTSESDDALSWDGDEGVSPAPKPTHSAPPRAHTEQALSPERTDRGAIADDEPSDDVDDERAGLSTSMLLTLGVVGGVYLLYSVGWVVGGLRLKPLANFFVADAMFVPWFVLAIAAPTLWFLAAWVLTRGRAGWIRVGALLLGVVLLVPWPFVTVGAIGS